MPVSPMKMYMDVKEKLVIITGANTGIGYETALELAKRGAHVVIACRDESRATEALVRIKAEWSTANVVFEQLDLAELQSIRNFSKRIHEKYQKIDILINNAGIMACPYARTKDGFEMQFGVNHLGHFLLTNLLIDLIKQAAPSRIINVSSLAHKSGKINWDDLNSLQGYSEIRAYSQSKLANILFTLELTRRYKDAGITSVSLHPGVVRTELTRNLKGCLGCLFVIGKPCFNLFSIDSKKGAETTLYCALSEDIAIHNGRYFSECRPQKLSTKICNEEDAKRLWNISMQLVGLDE